MTRRLGEKIRHQSIIIDICIEKSGFQGVDDSGILDKLILYSIIEEELPITMMLQSLVEKVMKLFEKSSNEKNKKRDYLRDDKKEPIIWYKGLERSRYDGTGIKGIEYGVFFSNNKRVAESYVSNEGYVMHAYISVSDPFIIDAKYQGYEHIPWDCNPSNINEFSEFQHRLTKVYPKANPTTDRFSVDQIARFIRLTTSHDAVIIHNVYEEGIFLNFPATSVCIWDNACIKVIDNSDSLRA